MKYDIDKYLKERDQLNEKINLKVKEFVFQALGISSAMALGHFVE